jgi:hypothetical protein
MRRWLIFATRLYPSRWRSRYEQEFQALLEDIHPGWREFADVARGALIMQVRSGTAFLKLAAAMCVAGAVIAAGLSFLAPPRYVSSAVVRITPPKDDIDGFTLDQAEAGRQEVLSRGRLAALIQKLDLYPNERSRLPLEDVIEQMRKRDVRIDRTDASSFRITFDYPDREIAQAVADELATGFSEHAAATAKNRAALWRQLFDDYYKESASHDAPPPGAPGQAVATLAASNRPERPAGPNRLVFASWGVLFGALAALPFWRPKGTLRAALFAFAGTLVFFEVSFLFPETYTSVATVRIGAPWVPERVSGATLPSLAEHFAELKLGLLGDENMARLRQSVAVLNLSPGDLSRIRIEPHIPPGSHAVRSFQISFSNSDPNKAKAVVNQLVAMAMEQTFIAKKALAARSGNALLISILEHQAGERLEVLDPASLPDSPVTPNRMTFAGFGCGLGLLLSLLPFRRPAALSLVPAHSSL